MSHEATTWAIRQRGVSPAAKLVLFHLADRFHPDHGCFPAQATLAQDCEMSRASLNVQLDALEAAGLIRREARIDEATKKQLSTRYRLKCERGFVPAASARQAAPAGAAEGDAAAENPESRVQNLDTAPAEPCPEKPESRVQLNGHGYIAEPVSEPVRDRKKSAGASAGAQTGAPSGSGQGETPDGFAAFWADWLRLVPSGVSDSARTAAQAWQGLGLDDRAAAAGALERWVLASKAARRNWTAPAGSKYLADMLWRNLPGQNGASGAAGPCLVAQPWSRDWWAVFWGRLANGGRVAYLLAEAERGRAFSAALAEIAAGRPEALRACPSDGRVWPLWRDWLAAQGLRLPAFRDAQVWLHLPGAAPPATGLDVWTGFRDEASRAGAGEERAVNA